MNALNELKKTIKKISDSYSKDTIGGWITGNGPVPCNILFIGEAPGKTEVEKGKPFIGKAGVKFESYLNTIGLERTKIRITNTCYFRPIKIKTNSSGKKTVSNRPPKVSEIKLFEEILNKEIELVNPEIIITLGNTPLKRFTEFKNIGECHGKLYFNEQIKRNIFPMYHPSSLIYNRNVDFLNIYENDWKKLKNILVDLQLV